MRKPVIAGNWKMYKTIAETVDFIEKIKPVAAQAGHCEVIVAPPFTTLAAAAATAKGSKVSVAAQNCHWDKEGAHTGDISTGMLRDAGCTQVIIGHSERRRKPVFSHRLARPCAPAGATGWHTPKRRSRAESVRSARRSFRTNGSAAQ